MDNELILHDHVQTCLLLQGIAIKDERLAAVTEQFTLLARMADRYLDETLVPELESAAVYLL